MVWKLWNLVSIMACGGCLECLLKLLNFLLTITGLAMVGYGIYLLVEWNRISGGGDDGGAPSPVAYHPEILKLGRPMFLLVSLSESFLDKLPKAWYGSCFICSCDLSEFSIWCAVELLLRLRT